MLSVVIPSLGNDCIYETIESLNSGTIIPDEIIVSLPSDKYSRPISDTYENVKTISANQYGQVIQRIVGFKKAQHGYVLQLDDDVILDNKCIERLIGAMKKHKMSTVSPYYMSDKKKSIHASQRYGFFWRVYYWLMNGGAGYKVGAIAKSGINFGVNNENLNVNDGEIEVEWQPGGCVLHEKENLIVDNYFPFSGKAYSEDLMHSFLLRSAGVKLLTCLDAYCYIKSGESVDGLFDDFKARYYFVKMASLSKSRMFLFYVIFVINRALKK